DIPKIKQDYFIRIFTNKSEKIIGSIPVVRNTKRNCNVIDVKEVMLIAKRKWNIDENDFHRSSIGLAFSFSKKREYFIWEVTRFIEKKKKPYFGKSYSLFINAHNGRLKKQEVSKV